MREITTETDYTITLESVVTEAENHYKQYDKAVALDQFMELQFKIYKHTAKPLNSEQALTKFRLLRLVTEIAHN